MTVFVFTPVGVFQFSAIVISFGVVVVDVVVVAEVVVGVDDVAVGMRCVMLLPSVEGTTCCCQFGEEWTLPNSTLPKGSTLMS